MFLVIFALVLFAAGASSIYLGLQLSSRMNSYQTSAPLYFVAIGALLVIGSVISVFARLA